MRALIRSTIVALLLCVSAPVSAGPLEDGAAAHRAGDYSTALRLWRPLEASKSFKDQLPRYNEIRQQVYDRIVL